MNWKRGTIALVLSIVQAGLGHIYNRQLGRAILYLIFFPCCVLLMRVTVVHQILWGFFTFVAIGLVAQLFVIVDATRSGFRQEKAGGLPVVKRWVLISALALAGLNVVGNWGGFYLESLLGLRGYVTGSESMAPGLLVGDRVLVDMLAYRRTSPKEGDVVIFTRNDVVSGVWTKRVIAVGGDTVRGTGRGVMLNGQLIREPYLAPTAKDPNSPSGVFEERTIPIGEFFVLGDNRDNSYDSRHFGDVRDIPGKVLVVYWSKDRSRIGRPVR